MSVPIWNFDPLKCAIGKTMQLTHGIKFDSQKYFLCLQIYFLTLCYYEWNIININLIKTNLRSCVNYIFVMNRCFFLVRHALFLVFLLPNLLYVKDVVRLIKCKKKISYAAQKLFSYLYFISYDSRKNENKR